MCLCQPCVHAEAFVVLYVINHPIQDQLLPNALDAKMQRVEATLLHSFAGELDGARMALAVWGRRTASILSLLTIVFMGLASFQYPLAFYWVLLILILQRGPVLPAQVRFVT